MMDGLRYGEEQSLHRIEHVTYNKYSPVVALPQKSAFGERSLTYLARRRYDPTKRVASWL